MPTTFAGCLSQTDQRWLAVGRCVAMVKRPTVAGRRTAVLRWWAITASLCLVLPDGGAVILDP